MTTGVVVSFDERNGFGFIRSRAFAQDVFVHARSVKGGRLLRAGQRVRFQAESSEKGPRAVHVQPRQAALRLVAKLTPEALVASLLAVALLALVVSFRFAAGWSWPAAWLAAILPVTFAAFVLDKRRAIFGRRRLSESVLLGLALAGGSPAALIAMPLLRHKTQKGPFRLAVGLIVALQLAALAAYWWLTR